MNINSPFVLGYKTAYIRDLYILGHALGKGRYGSTTYVCTEISTGIKYACKSIPKAKLTYKEDAEDIRREIQIMHHLANNRNIVSIKGEYEDDLEVHIVMELCFGGDLFYPKKSWYYSEKTVAALVRIVVGVVATCHSNGVMIRGLKLDDFLLVSKHDILSIKAVHFGSSIFFEPGEEFTEVVGSDYYIAPEVHFKQYGPEADIWSAGVILFILLSGVPPFWGETRKEVRTAVLKGTRYTDFESDPWPLISDSAKDLLKNMLCSRPSDRFTAAQVLRHPWIYQNGVAPDTPLPSDVLSRLTRFSSVVKLQKFASWQIYNATVDPRESTAKFQYSNKDECESFGSIADESQQAFFPNPNGSDASSSIAEWIAESQKASFPGQYGYDSCVTCAESQKAYCTHREGYRSCGSITDESHQASDPIQDNDNDSCHTCATSQKAYCPRRVGYGKYGLAADNDSCGTCATSQKAYCPRRVGYRPYGSIADNDSCGTCATSQKAYCPRWAGYGKYGLVADNDSCGTCATSQKAYCPRGAIYGKYGSIADNDSCGTCATSQKAYCPRRIGYRPYGSIASEPYQDYNLGRDGYNSCGSIDESQNAYDQPKYEDHFEEDYLEHDCEQNFFEQDKEEGYASPPRQPRIKLRNQLASEIILLSLILRATNKCLTSEVDALKTVQKSLTSENDALRVTVKSVVSENDALMVVLKSLASENDALQCLKKESRESVGEENTRTLFERVRQRVGL